MLKFGLALSILFVLNAFASNCDLKQNQSVVKRALGELTGKRPPLKLMESIHIKADQENGVKYLSRTEQDQFEVIIRNDKDGKSKVFYSEKAKKRLLAQRLIQLGLVEKTFKKNVSSKDPATEELRKKLFQINELANKRVKEKYREEEVDLRSKARNGDLRAKEDLEDLLEELDDARGQILSQMIMSHLNEKELDVFFNKIDDIEFLKQIKSELEGPVNTDMNTIYIVDSDERLYIKEYPERGVFQHSSFNGGEPVYSAGRIHIQNGDLAYIDNSSGHYKPNVDHLDFSLRLLSDLGVDVNSATRMITGDYSYEIVMALRKENNETQILRPITMNPREHSLDINNDVKYFNKNQKEGHRVVVKEDKDGVARLYHSEASQERLLKERLVSLFKRKYADFNHLGLEKLKKRFDELDQELKEYIKSNHEPRLENIHRNSMFGDSDAADEIKFLNARLLSEKLKEQFGEREKLGREIVEAILKNRESRKIAEYITEIKSKLEAPITTRGETIYVIDANGKIYLKEQPTKFIHYHSTLNGGEAMASGGDIQIVNGIPEYIDNASGHYRPDSDHFSWSISYLEKLGLDLSGTDKHIIGE